MLLAIVGVMNSGETVPTPGTSTPLVESLTAGACSGSLLATAASIRVSWSIASPDPTKYTAKLYENDILASSDDVATFMSWDKTITGAVEGGPFSPWASNWTYRVDVVRKADGVVVSSRTAAPWVKSYGGCGEPT